MRKLTRKGFTLVELMIVVAIIGILAAIAIPNFIKFQAKSKQSEAKTNLKAIFTAEKSFAAERDQYATFTGAGFLPERGNRYAYIIGGTVNQARTGAALPAPTTATAATYFGGGFDGYEVDCFRLIGGACTTQTPAVPTKGGNSPYAAPTYATDNAGITAVTTPPGVAWGQGGSVLAHAIGNVDNDLGGDTWEVGVDMNVTVGTSVCTDPSSAPSGVPVNTWNDVNCD